MAARREGPPITAFSAVTSTADGDTYDLHLEFGTKLLIWHSMADTTTGGYISVEDAPRSTGPFIAYPGTTYAENLKTSASSDSYKTVLHNLGPYVRLTINVTDGTHTVVIQEVLS